MKETEKNGRSEHERGMDAERSLKVYKEVRVVPIRVTRIMIRISKINSGGGGQVKRGRDKNTDIGPGLYKWWKTLMIYSVKKSQHTTNPRKNLFQLTSDLLL